MIHGNRGGIGADCGGWGGVMGQVVLTLNGRTYRLACGDGEEQRLIALASEVKGKVDQLVREFGQVGESRLLLMAALLLADELMDSRSALEGALAEAAEALNMAAQAESQRVADMASQAGKGTAGARKG